MPKKITFIINNFVVGGVEKLLWDLIYRLDKDKFDISIITVFGSGPLKADFESIGVKVYLAGGTFPFYEDKITYKLLWVVLSPIVFIRLLLFLFNIKPNSVITSLYHADILGHLSAWILGVPKRIMIHHDVYRLHPIRAWIKKVFGVKLATVIIAVSPAVRDFLVDYLGAKLSSVIVIPNGIDVQRFKVNKKQTNSSIHFGMLGRLAIIKGPLVFAQALLIMQKEYNTSVPSHIGGDGVLKSKLLNLASKLPTLSIDGEINNIPAWLAKVDVLVVPSLSEGFGLVVLEGLAADKIIVASDLPAIRELITPGINGCLFGPGDTNALAKIMFKLASDKGFRAKIKNSTNLWCRDNINKYDINKTVSSYAVLLSGDEDQSKLGDISP